VHDRTGSARLARRAGLLWATAVAADLAAGRPPRPRFAIGGEATVEGRAALARLLAEVGRADNARQEFGGNEARYDLASGA
jgi:hypothetical protein